MYDFTFQTPGGVADAVRALAAEPEAKALAGGMTFIPVLKQRLNRPSSVIDLKRLGLVGISATDSTITIQAMTPHGTVAASPDIRARIPGLAHLASMIGDIQVRHRGTIGGSLANNDPSACYPASVLALDATIITDRRRIAAEAYFQGMFTTALAPDELITAVEFPIPLASAYAKFRNPASRYAMVGVFVAKTATGVRVAVTGAAQDGVFRHTAFEAALSRSFTPDALVGITTPAAGLNSDIHASAAYRAHLIGVMVRRAVAAAT